LDPSAFKLFLNTLWCLWKARCSFLYEGEKLCPLDVVGLIGQYSQTGLTLSRNRPLSGNSPPLPLDPSGLTCEIDGSFAQVNNGGYGGAGLLIARGEQLIRYSATYFPATSPLEAELKAFQLAIQAIQDLSLTHRLQATC
jgi:hypothetical protein